MSIQILKLQKSLNILTDQTRMLAYNKDKSFYKEELYNNALDMLFNHSPWGRNKVYVEAEVKGDDIVIHGIALSSAGNGW